ncbi:MAG: hypothetical protein M3Q07_04215 [Pseudobdellovibrionaceae bacterium]|nr:hypothetical protein [Pseudobdellovibrionaceae bacterium]
MSWKCLALALGVSFSSPGILAETLYPLGPKDLAIALPMTFRELPRDTLFPRTWFQTISNGFSQTSVGSALETESPYADWQVVSLRLAPCAPLGQTPVGADQNCWPEIRLVWQPVQRKIRLHERYMENAGDDRAVHALYPVEPARFLNASDALRVQTHIRTLTEGKALDAASRKEFQSARDLVLRELLPAITNLRERTLPAAVFLGFGIRPEADDSSLQKSFGQRLTNFLNRWASPPDLRTLTAFSLPEGREPAHLDEWVFLAFRGEKNRLIPDPILIRSARDGRVLANLGPSMRGSQNRDDDKLYDLLNGSFDAEELASSVMLRVNDIERLTPVVRDRERLLVANTSCVSCHKMNDLRFDFHNFSYLEDRDITISPRVKRDVELDLIWLQKAGHMRQP